MFSSEKNNEKEKQEDDLGKAIRNKIVINDIKFYFYFSLFQAENVIDQTTEYVSKSYIEKIFFLLKVSLLIII